MDSFSEFCQDSDINIFAHIGPDAKIIGPDLSDICSNSDDDQAHANIGGDHGEGYNNEDNNEDWSLWDEYNHDFYAIPFCSSSGFKPLQNGQTSLSPHIFLYYF